MAILRTAFAATATTGTKSPSSSTAPDEVTEPAPVDEILVDVRSLQKPAGATPLDRAFLGLVNALPAAWRPKIKLSAFIDGRKPLNPAIAACFDEIVDAVPLRPSRTLIVDTVSSETPLRFSLRSVKAPGLHFVSCSDGALPSATRHDHAAATTVLFRPTGSADHAANCIVAPVALAQGFSGAPSELAAIELDRSAADPRPTLLVDMAVSLDSESDRCIRTVAARRGCRVIVLGAQRHATDNRPVIQPALPVLAAMVRQASLVLSPSDRSPACIAVAEARQLGGRVLPVTGSLTPGLLERALDALDSTALSADDQSADLAQVWRDIVAALPPARAAAAPDALRRIAFVSAMFPQPGGPPHSSLDTVLALSKLAVVDVWTNADMRPTDRSRVNAVYRLDSGFDPNRYDATVYVIGNNDIHSDIYRLLHKHGGTLILHDAQMVDFLLRYDGHEKVRHLMSRELDRTISSSEMHKILSQRDRIPSPFLSEIVGLANPVIVHSPVAADVIRDRYGVPARYFPVARPYDFPASTLLEPARLLAKAVTGVDPARIAIGTFGEVQPGKGAFEFLGLAKDLLDWGYDAQFLLVGPVEDQIRQELQLVLERLEISEFVQIVGHVPERQYMDYLRSVDIGVQIRRTPFGQVSGALLDSVSAGMPGVASDSLAASIEAPPFIHRLHDQASSFLFAEKIADLIDQGVHNQRCGEGWSDFIEKHEFSSYARNLVDLLFDPSDANGHL